MYLKIKPTLFSILLITSIFVMWFLVTIIMTDALMDATNRPTYTWEPSACVIAIFVVFALWILSLYQLARHYVSAGKEPAK